ncbi:MAG: PleD family two-component system response regulator [Pleurocapsa sp.]
MLNKSLGKPQKIIRKEPLILVIEDNKDNMLYHTTILELSNYQFLKATDGKIGLDIAMDKLPDLILLDIVMPKVNGIEVIETLRRNPLTNHIYTIAITGLVNPHQVQKIIDAGCDDYLLKPFLVGDLEAKIKRFLKIGLETLASDSK